jgi:hypothetical protein
MGKKSGWNRAGRHRRGVLCQTSDCGSLADCQVKGSAGWSGLHCTPCALEVVKHQMFQVTGGMGASIRISPMPVGNVMITLQ